MRLHISLDAALVRHVDEVAGRRGRSRFIAQAVHDALEVHRRWEAIESAFGRISDSGHAWDEDPAAWVREQRLAGNGPLEVEHWPVGE
jgi:predicted transcriptional regulator